MHWSFDACRPLHAWHIPVTVPAHKGVGTTAHLEGRELGEGRKGSVCERMCCMQGWSPELLNQATLAELGAEAAVPEAGPEQEAPQVPAGEDAAGDPLNALLVNSAEGQGALQPAIPSSRGDVPLTAFGNNGALALNDLRLE